jgi:hypothetical protein
MLIFEKMVHRITSVKEKRPRRLSSLAIRSLSLSCSVGIFEIPNDDVHLQLDQPLREYPAEITLELRKGVLQALGLFQCHTSEPHFMLLAVG